MKIFKPQEFAIVEPTISFPAASLSPNKTSLVEQRSEEYRARDESEQAHEHQSESHRHRFVALLDTPHRNQEITRSTGRATELYEAHDGQEQDELSLTVDRACSVLGTTASYEVLEDRLVSHRDLNTRSLRKPNYPQSAAQSCFSRRNC